jgi:hypothetical protein
MYAEQQREQEKHAEEVAEARREFLEWQKKNLPPLPPLAPPLEAKFKRVQTIWSITPHSVDSRRLFKKEQEIQKSNEH